MSIEYERKLNDKFAEFCRFKCGMINEEEIYKEYIDADCEECGFTEFDVSVEVAVSPCKYCRIREFIDYIRDDMEV